jgi:hypothetical protein
MEPRIASLYRKLEGSVCVADLAPWRAGNCRVKTKTGDPSS